MKEIQVIINEDGSVKILYKGFYGGKCFLEAQKLYQKLKALGVDVKIESTVKTEEYYVTEKAKSKQFYVNGDF